MKTTTKVLIIALASSLLAGCCTQHKETATQWEYKVTYPERNSDPNGNAAQERLLNDLAKDGWIFIQKENGSEFFKRPKK